MIAATNMTDEHSITSHSWKSTTTRNCFKLTLVDLRYQYSLFPILLAEYSLVCAFLENHDNQTYHTFRHFVSTSNDVTVTLRPLSFVRLTVALSAIRTLLCLFTKRSWRFMYIGYDTKNC